MDAKGARALVERLAREGRYSPPAGAELEPHAEVTLVEPDAPAAADEISAGPAERAA